MSHLNDDYKSFGNFHCWKCHSVSCNVWYYQLYPFSMHIILYSFGNIKRDLFTLAFLLQWSEYAPCVILYQFFSAANVDVFHCFSNIYSEIRILVCINNVAYPWHTLKKLAQVTCQILMQLHSNSCTDLSRIGLELRAGKWLRKKPRLFRFF